MKEATSFPFPPSRSPFRGSGPRRLAWTAALAALALGGWGCGGADELRIPVVYLAAGQVVDPTEDPFLGIAGVEIRVENDSSIPPVTSDAEGFFVLQGIPPGTHRLLASRPGFRSTLSIDLQVDANVTDAVVPLFTDAQIDSILTAQGAPPWDRARALFGAFALRSTGVPLGDAALAFTPDPGATLVQTGEGADPIVFVNGTPGSYSLRVARGGFDWEDPFGTVLRAGTVTFGAPRALPNLTGFLFANRLSGPAVEGASVAVEDGPEGRAGTTDFLGQFRFVGLTPGTYVVRLERAGLLPSLTWPQEMAEDTTLSLVAVAPDTLDAWIAAAAGPPAEPGRGHLAVDVRNRAGGAPIAGASLRTSPVAGASLPLAANRPALLVNLPPGGYTVTVDLPGRPGAHVVSGVLVRAGAVTFTRLDL